ncbi:MAG: FliH/SctL family protein [Blastocatellia bacterium]
MGVLFAGGASNIEIKRCCVQKQNWLQLAVKVAEKIIGRELQTHPATVAYIALTALQQARQSEMITLRANPADLPTLESFREHFAHSGRIQYVDILPDQHIEPGGCRIETEVGTVDAQIAVQLHTLGRALLAQKEEQQ